MKQEETDHKTNDRCIHSAQKSHPIDWPMNVRAHIVETPPSGSCVGTARSLLTMTPRFFRVAHAADGSTYMDVDHWLHECAKVKDVLGGK